MHRCVALSIFSDAPPLQAAVKNMFIRGGAVRYVSVPPEAVDTELLADAARREALEAAKPSAGTKR